VVIALGANDVGLLVRSPSDLYIHPSPVAIADEIEALTDRAREAGLNTFVATIPPRFDLPGTFAQVHIDSINFLLRKRGLPIVDFDTGFDEADFRPDGVHLTAAGQGRRARRVLQALPAPSFVIGALSGFAMLLLLPP
jgi:lysophospholipase L1-like esterase